MKSWKLNNFLHWIVNSLLLVCTQLDSSWSALIRRELKVQLLKLHRSISSESRLGKSIICSILVLTRVNHWMHFSLNGPIILSTFFVQIFIYCIQAKREKQLPGLFDIKLILLIWKVTFIMVNFIHRVWPLFTLSNVKCKEIMW